jgi:hypothetical protein
MDIFTHFTPIQTGINDLEVGFREKTSFCRQKLAKIAQNSEKIAVKNWRKSSKIVIPGAKFSARDRPLAKYGTVGV